MEKLRVNMVVDEDANIIEKMKEAYMGCPSAVKYVRELGIPDEQVDANITKIYDFVSDINYCRQCPGIKNCKKQNPLLCTKIVYTHGIVDRQLVPCPRFLDRVTFEKQFQVRDFEDAWLDVTLRNVDPSAAKKVAMEKYVNFVKEGTTDWIYLTGGPNSGRSFLAAAFATDAAKRKKGPICFINCAQRMRELNDINFKDKKEFQKTLDKYCSCQVLVLDDFGNEFKNDFVRDAILFQIISFRASKKLFTIVTSDFSIKDIVTLYSTSKAAEVRAKQIGTLIKSVAGKEINLGDLPIY